MHRTTLHSARGVRTESAHDSSQHYPDEPYNDAEFVACTREELESLEYAQTQELSTVYDTGLYFPAPLPPEYASLPVRSNEPHPAFDWNSGPSPDRFDFWS